MSNLPPEGMFFCMRNAVILLVLWTLLLASCGKTEKTDAPLTRDEMVNLMMEVYLSESRLALLPNSKDSSYRLFLAHQDSIFRRRGLTDSTLHKAYSYYIAHPAELEAIYDAIIDSLTLREQRGR